MKQSASNRKVNEQAREVIASILLFDVSDPRLHMVTITGCEVSYDRSVCNVYYTVDPDRYADVQAAFEAAAGHIRSLMAKKLSWRVAPELRFFVDKSVDQAEAINYALNTEREHLESKIVDDTIGEDREY
ncbi:30S ribosome-binding factor RbfA [Adlercreutzia equolifaciens]|uniref:30S ribosome-binding factor RbfA n=2 Tax=Adlercreutzia TaxID=447020 RepID=UPI0023B038CD|nr:30S ribosome-binding factor RbfA [Adlercreutzia equolifaciens]MDE8703120.1 30S ribosome-binding factor RbfA [Adlercreutzia equolifaciens]